MKAADRTADAVDVDDEDDEVVREDIALLSPIEELVELRGLLELGAIATAPLPLLPLPPLSP